MKNKNSLADIFKKVANDIGLGVMAFATVVGLMELPTHQVKAYALPLQSLRSDNGAIDELNNPMRREKEEINEEYVSYSESQRTVPRSVKY